MTWTLTASLGEFRTRAGEFLRARPAENTGYRPVEDRLVLDFTG
ncbi:hypothetical protein [Streptomyces sp. CB01881]|nr:hypothetical protein [Streptomyces sp. CB01881]